MKKPRHQFESSLQYVNRPPKEIQENPARETVENITPEIFETLKQMVDDLQLRGEQLRQQNDQLAENAELIEIERARFEDLFYSAPYGFLSTSPSGIIKAANSAAGRMLSYDPDKLIGLPLPVFIPASEKKGFRTRLSRSARDGEKVESWEQSFSPKNGAPFLALVTIVRSSALKEETCLHWQLHDITERKQTEQILERSRIALKRSQEELRFLAARLLKAQEEERKRISRELHDDLSQRLALLAVQSETLEREASSSPVMRIKLSILRSELGELSEIVHRIAYQLHPSILDDLGLTIALQSYIEDFSRREGIKVKISSKNVPKSLPSDLSLCLYRVTQECLRNIAKHSQAKRASVSLEGSRHVLYLSIRDFGIGFDPETAHAQKGGLGVISMRERVRLLNGKIRWSSRPARGTQIRVSIPLSSG